MSEWITDRLPTLEDAVHYSVLLWDEENKQVLIWTFDSFGEGTPWQPIPTPAPYVKPKRWTVEWHDPTNCWRVIDAYAVMGYLHLDSSQADAARRICDIYNEVMP
jgi:hypothetical protein